jgi:hypothetical protein
VKRPSTKALMTCAGNPARLMFAETQTLVSTTTRTAHLADFLSGQRHLLFQLLGSQISTIPALRFGEQAPKALLPLGINRRDRRLWLTLRQLLLQPIGDQLL